MKPAVIAVRVKVKATSETAAMEQWPTRIQSIRSEFADYKFFRKFAPEGVPGLRQRPEMVTGEGSGFFVTADGYAVTNYQRRRSGQVGPSHG